MSLREWLEEAAAAVALVVLLASLYLLAAVLQ